MVLRARDWLAQALRGLGHAEGSLSLGYYEWACFSSHQAAEKALKAVYQALGSEAWGHDLTRLLRGLRGLGAAAPGDLDFYKHYIAARCPSGFTAGSTA